MRTFTSETGAKPVEDWVRSLDAEARSEVLHTISLLRRQGIALGMPFAKHLGGNLWELRARGPDGIYRVIYFHWKGRTFGLVHGFTKKAQATPRRELEIARTRQQT